MTGIFLMTNPSTSAEQRKPLPRMREAFACHGEVFEISCDGDEILVFETARYGRGVDPMIASLCRVPFSAVCDVDVRFSLNRACAGRRRCVFPVDSVSFGGPCGYDEFLAVIYRCVAVRTIIDVCSTVSASSEQVFLRQSLLVPPREFSATNSPNLAVYYLSSPSYPGRYPSDSDCTWSVAACSPPDGSTRRLRTVVNVTTVDIELDVRRAGKCHDVIEISGRSVTSLPVPWSHVTGSVPIVNGDVFDTLPSGTVPLSPHYSTNQSVFFAECGAVGKQTISVDSCDVTVTFRTGRSAIGQRGFLLRLDVTTFVIDDVTYSTSSSTAVVNTDTITAEMTSVITWPATRVFLVSKHASSIAAGVLFATFVFTVVACGGCLRRWHRSELSTSMKRIGNQLPPDVVGSCAYSDDAQDDVTSGQAVRPSLTYEWNESLAFGSFDVIISCAECDATDRKLPSRQASSGTKFYTGDDLIDDVRWRAAPLPVTTCPSCRIHELGDVSIRGHQCAARTCPRTERNFRHCIICETT